MNSLDGSGQIAAEPDWGVLLGNPDSSRRAAELWLVITTEMRSRDILAASNGHAIMRLVLVYLAYEDAAAEVAKAGAVMKPKRGNPRAIARISPHFAAMREAAADAVTLEAELGLSPKSRGRVAKVEKRARAARASDAYLRPVSG